MLSKRAMSRTLLALVVVVIIVVVAVAGYVAIPKPTTTTSTTLSSSTMSSVAVNTLVIDANNWPAGDLNQLYSVNEIPWPNWLTYSVYQPLVSINATAEYGQGVVQYIPGLAENWTVSSDGRTYTFNLRNDVKFSDGNPFNAYQVWAEMYGFIYLSGNSTGWLESYPVFDMSTVKIGPSTFDMINQSGLITPSQEALNIMMDQSEPIYVTGPNQIVFHLSSPFLWFPGALIVYCGLMFDTQWVLQHGGFGSPAQYNSYFNLHPIPGSGPYVVSGVLENNYVKFAQDTNYWAKDWTPEQVAANPYFDPGHAQNVIVYYKPDDVARYTDLSAGTAQIADLAASSWTKVSTDPKYSFYVNPPWGSAADMLVLNTKMYPTNITLVRQAIVHAINYTDIEQAAFHGYLNPWVGPEYPVFKDYYNLGNMPGYDYNVTLAKEDLAKANLPSMPTLTFRIASDVSYDAVIADIIQSDLSQIGISVNIISLPESKLLASFGSYQFEMQSPSDFGNLQLSQGVAWYPSTMTPAEAWVDFLSEHSTWGNTAIYSNPTVQKCIDSFTSTTDESLIKSLCTAAQQQLYEDAPYGWIGALKLWYGDGSIVWQKNVVNSFLLDPVFGGQDSDPILNTVTFVS